MSFDDGPTVQMKHDDLSSSWHRLHGCKTGRYVTSVDARAVQGHEDRVAAARKCHLIKTVKYWEVYLSIAFGRHVRIHGFDGRREMGFPEFRFWVSFPDLPQNPSKITTDEDRPQGHHLVSDHALPGRNHAG